MNTAYEDDDESVAGVDFGGGDMADAPMDIDGGYGGEMNAGDTQDFFVGDQAVGDDYGGGFDAGLDEGTPVDGETQEETSGAAQGPRLGGFEPFDPRRAPNERDLILAMTEPGANGSSLDYFDQTFLKNWAGPEHWKLRKVIRRRKSLSLLIYRPLTFV